MIGGLNSPKLGGVIATTSGTSIDFTGIPSWVKKITFMARLISTNGSSRFQVRLGTLAGGIEAAGYRSMDNASGLITTGFACANTGGSYAYDIVMNLTKIDNSNNWMMLGTAADTAVGYTSYALSGDKALAGVLDRIRLTTVNGTDIFDAGSVNILYE